MDAREELIEKVASLIKEAISGRYVMEKVTGKALQEMGKKDTSAIVHGMWDHIRKTFPSDAKEMAGRFQSVRPNLKGAKKSIKDQIRTSGNLDKIISTKSPEELFKLIG